jgi:ubiquinone/menaquinone biosynthesis C-methylase UbiE
MSLLKRIMGQCKKPSGRFGRFLATGMNYGHSGLTRWGLGFIEITSDINILDIGCGGGKTVKQLAGITIDGKVVGIDYSPDAVVVARKKNCALINAGRVEIFQEAVSSMRFSDGAFGLITAFESHYFWPDFRNDLKEVHRVTKQNGQLLIVGTVYKNKKYDRRNKRFVDAIGMTYLSIEEFKDILEGVGYSEVDALEEKNKGWFAVKCKKQERDAA